MINFWYQSVPTSFLSCVFCEVYCWIWLLNKYDAAENNPWGVKGGIFSKLRNDIIISDANNSLMICRIMKEVLLAKADGVTFKPDLKGRSKNGRKSIIDMNSQEAQITADAVELGMSTFNAWSLANNHREVNYITSVWNSDVRTCIAKLKP